MSQRKQLKRKSQAKAVHLLRYRRGIPGDYSERDKAICDLRATGLTLEKVGDKFSLSRERVSQIVQKQERKAKMAEHLAPLRDAFSKPPRKRA